MTGQAGAMPVPSAGSGPLAVALGLLQADAPVTIMGAPQDWPRWAVLLPHVLAATSLKRMDGMADLPTVAEQGYPGFEALAWNGLFTATGTPPEVVARINADVNAVMQDAGVREAFAKQGLIIGGGTPDSFKTFIAAEGKKWGAIIQKVGITVD